jgi:hypothetical protein
MVSLIAAGPNCWNAATTHRDILSIRSLDVEVGCVERSRGGGLDEAENSSQQRSATPAAIQSPVASRSFSSRPMAKG